MYSIYIWITSSVSVVELEQRPKGYTINWKTNKYYSIQIQNLYNGDQRGIYKNRKKNGGAPQKKHIDKKKSPSCGHIFDNIKQ